MWHFILPVQSMGIFFPINFSENMAKSWTWYKQKIGYWIQYMYLCHFKADLLLGCCSPLFQKQGEQLATCFSLLVFSWYFTMSKVRICNSVLTYKELEHPYIYWRAQMLQGLWNCWLRDRENPGSSSIQQPNFTSDISNYELFGLPLE